jgi:proteasome lid subunit RPN8/RPN11
MLRLSWEQAEAIRQHAIREYPHECCGVLLGSAAGEAKRVREVVPLPNLRADPERSGALLPLEDPRCESARNRYFIDPIDLLRVVKDARSRDLEILGYYHSHPDQPAQPSAHDRELAWPGYSYLIVEVLGGEPQEMTCWVLPDEGGAFKPQPIEWLNPQGSCRICLL